MNRIRLARLEQAIAGSECPVCTEPLVIVERLAIVAPGDALEPPASEPPPPGRCPRCGRDWSSCPRIVEEIRLDFAECLL
jgi:hypothetical protein